MGLIEQILGRSGKLDLDNLPEPPAELKEFLVGLTGAIDATLKGEKCPSCGEIHDLKALVLGGQQAQPYAESDGLSDEYEYVPKVMAAIQFLPGNVPDVMEFLFDRGITFGYAITANGESRILLITAGEELDQEENELVYGRWAVTTGSRTENNLNYVVYDDADFRRVFRSTVQGSAPAAAVVDEMDGDKLLKDAEQDALDAYGDE